MARNYQAVFLSVPCSTVPTSFSSVNSKYGSVPSLCQATDQDQRKTCLSSESKVKRSKVAPQYCAPCWVNTAEDPDRDARACRGPGRNSSVVLTLKQQNENSSWSSKEGVGESLLATFAKMLREYGT